ncbi:conserved Plasmodium protein, unknown function [Plasmodium ovale curtisi]|uniref:Uncharacterized protein n=1 Tax=Plasmodium ovale curtisi TaxID=864141 RepID=A0A1A8WG13_PLAOA|nr:conserved Plasmodium protein, unknown function [Plasmodium ovale curtisi]
MKISPANNNTTKTTIAAVTAVAVATAFIFALINTHTCVCISGRGALRNFTLAVAFSKSIQKLSKIEKKKENYFKMDANMEEKFREAFILFSSCNDTLELFQFYELMNSFGIILTPEEKTELPVTVSMDFWLNFAKKHYNSDEPFKHVKTVSEKNPNVQIKIHNFIGVMKALDTRLTDKDLEILLQIANPEKKETLDLDTVSQRLTQAI